MGQDRPGAQGVELSASNDGNDVAHFWSLHRPAADPDERRLTSIDTARTAECSRLDAGTCTLIRPDHLGLVDTLPTDLRSI